MVEKIILAFVRGWRALLAAAHHRRAFRRRRHQAKRRWRVIR
jgi:hypothetical protein